MTPYVMPERTTNDVPNPDNGTIARDPDAPWRLLIFWGGRWLSIGTDYDMWPRSAALPTTDPESDA